ncbi:uncharacterized protein TRIVIDRAFT_64841 [Trichoderma virens Gv29-8]|uniref:Uncharacterized protein n=1 Tax=Hypocrea virens (strain Gv29-8 / FGSC 10586) TaxID=413071 RepID=G9NC10_HYPVG|nr:uncharacterized protein TRIVIDRAFT_64841 [Trichoderma virens Gv29-8]EHK15235.1 hypothetical protein TRIVIDRAFT_64841 [Trichoderma virens Gv29-8]
MTTTIRASWSVLKRGRSWEDRDAVESGESVRVLAVERPPSIGLWLSPPVDNCRIDIGHVKDGDDTAKAKTWIWTWAWIHCFPIAFRFALSFDEYNTLHHRLCASHTRTVSPNRKHGQTGSPQRKGSSVLAYDGRHEGRSHRQQSNSSIHIPPSCGALHNAAPKTAIAPFFLLLSSIFGILSKGGLPAWRP